MTALLEYRFIPRIRDLPSKRVYVFGPNIVPKELKPLIGGKVREGTIIANWPDILRGAATMIAGIMSPSQLLRKFAAYSPYSQGWNCISLVKPIMRGTIVLFPRAGS